MRLGSVEAWLTSPSRPQGWVLQPWSGELPVSIGKLNSRGLAILDLELCGTAGTETTAAQLGEFLEWLVARSQGCGGLGLVGVDDLAAASFLAAASHGNMVTSLVLANGCYQGVAEHLPTSATRLIASSHDPDAVRQARGVADGLVGRHDLIIHPNMSEEVLAALSLEWFERTLIPTSRSVFVSWLEELVLRRRRRFERQLAFSVQASALLLALGGPQARAGTITVGGGCTLYDAIDAAENDEPTGLCTAGAGADTVVLGGGTYLLNTSYGSGLPSVSSAVVIQGNGATLDGEGVLRVAQVTGGQLTFESTTITGGTATAGGGVYNLNGELTLRGTTISGNTATRGGGVFNQSVNGNQATVVISGSSLSGNTATGDGGGLASAAAEGSSAHIKVVDSTISGNTASNGGAIHCDAQALSSFTITLDGGIITGNTVSVDGGAIEALTSGSGAHGDVTITATTLTGNTANGSGGAINLETIEGGTATITVAGALLRDNLADGGNGGAINAKTMLGATVTVDIGNSSLIGNTAGLDGGAILADTLTGATVTIAVAGGSIESNSAGSNGGGLFNRVNEAAVGVTLFETTVSGNTANASGGGVYNHATFAGGATVTIEASTLSGNTADSGGAGSFHLVDGTAAVVANIRNSTISGNTVTTGNGGGVELVSLDSGSAALVVDNTVFSGNSATVGGAIALQGKSPKALGATLRNSIITNSQGGGDCAAAGAAQFLGTNNLIGGVRAPGGNASCANITNGPVTQFDQQLADNGGPTKTHALGDGSNAIDAGVGSCADLATDQRGARRPLDGDGDQIATCDIGPFEFGETPIFHDGFESGDSSRWDRVEGGAKSTANKERPRR